MNRYGRCCIIDRGRNNIYQEEEKEECFESPMDRSEEILDTDHNLPKRGTKQSD
jgi:hypothetical protein